MLKLMLKMKKLPTNPEAGYTILEAIIAILIVTVLMSVVAPVIGFSVGTRLSAKRIELASQASRSYIDWVRADTCEKGAITSINCARTPEKVADIKNVSAPSTSALNTDCTVNGQYCDESTTKQLYCVDGDGDGKCSKTSLKDMIVQAVSYNKTWTTTREPYKGYQLGIRVYRADAFSGTELKLPTASTSVNAIGGDRRYPLTTLTTEISPTEGSFDNMQKRLCEEVTPRPSSCP